MSLIVVGLNHRSAPVELREKLSLEGEALQNALANLYRESLIHEVVILSTCNRLEIYAQVEDTQQGWDLLHEHLAQIQNVSRRDLNHSLYSYTGRDTVLHLMRVTAGLDSMILGEPQILGQVNTAFGEAHGAGTTGANLSRLFFHAVYAGKRARTETDISRHTTSVSHAAVRLAQQHFGDLSQVRGLIVGAGEMAELAADALFNSQVASITCINRTRDRADELAQRVGGTSRSWYELIETLSEADLVICSTGAPHAVIHAEEVALTLPKRGVTPLVLIDIAVPRDVEESVGDLPNVTRYDIDDLNRVLDVNLAQRQASAVQVEDIMQDEAEEFMAWYQSRTVVPVIVELRQKIAEIAHLEVEDTVRRMELDERERQLIDRLAHRIINKILHEPTVRLKTQAIEGKGNLYADVLSDLFALEALYEKDQWSLDNKNND